MPRLAATLLLLVASALPAPSPAAAGDDAATVFAHPADARTIKAALGPVVTTLAAAQVISGGYTQDKFLRELAKPLRASGDFLFVRDLGVAWRTALPFASELIITHDALIDRQDGGSTTRIAADQRPAVRLVARIFFAVFSLDFDQLGQLFTMSLINDGAQGWQLGLQPKQVGATGVISAIIVSGHRNVEAVRLFESGGDRTDIEFHDTQLSSVPATDAQRARFATVH